jgi:hypothetical protein
MSGAALTVAVAARAGAQGQGMAAPVRDAVGNPDLRARSGPAFAA